VMNAIRDQAFRDFVFALQETGCRPSEVSRVTSTHADLELGVWVFPDHKTAKKTGKPRIVYLTPAMIELTKCLMAKYADGPLFRSPRGGKPFTRNNIRCRFKRLREKLPHLKCLIAYAYRHSFATDALVNGVGIAQVAELLGHTSTDMVMRHYSHIAGNVGHMREAAMKAANHR
jgi:integrase